MLAARSARERFLSVTLNEPDESPVGGGFMASPVGECQKNAQRAAAEPCQSTGLRSLAEPRHEVAHVSWA